jgi:hypothetical protein
MCHSAMNVYLFVLSAITFDSVLTGNAMYTYYNEIPKLMNTLGMAAHTLNKYSTQDLTLNQDLHSITARSIYVIRFIICNYKIIYLHKLLKTVSTQIDVSI